MTIPLERTRAVLQTKQFLRELQNPMKSPGVPEEVRREANRLLRHYPDPWDLDAAHRGAPDWWGPVQERGGAMTYEEWHLWMSLANDLHALLKSEPDQADAVEALASEIVSSFNTHLPEVHIERLGPAPSIEGASRA